MQRSTGGGAPMSAAAHRAPAATRTTCLHRTSGLEGPDRRLARAEGGSGMGDSSDTSHRPERRDEAISPIRTYRAENQSL